MLCRSVSPCRIKEMNSLSSPGRWLNSKSTSLLSGPAGRRLLSFRKYSSVVVSVFVCTLLPPCRTPWHAFWVSESHNLLLEFGRHSKGCIFLFCKIEAAFKILRIHVAEKEPGILTCDYEPMTSRSFNFSFWDRHVDKEIQSTQCVLFLHGSIFSISMLKLSKKIKVYKT